MLFGRLQQSNSSGVSALMTLLCVCALLVSSGCSMIEAARCIDVTFLNSAEDMVYHAFQTLKYMGTVDPAGIRCFLRPGQSCDYRITTNRNGEAAGQGVIIGEAVENVDYSIKYKDGALQIGSRTEPRKELELKDWDWSGTVELEWGEITEAGPKIGHCITLLANYKAHKTGKPIDWHPKI